MKALLKYPGAKNRLATWIVSHIPPLNARENAQKLYT